MGFVVSASLSLVFLVNLWLFEGVRNLIIHLILIYRKLLHLIKICRLHLSLHLSLGHKVRHLSHRNLALELHLLQLLNSHLLGHLHVQHLKSRERGVTKLLRLGAHLCSVKFIYQII
jgi:hypothetical protein